MNASIGRLLLCLVLLLPGLAMAQSRSQPYDRSAFLDPDTPTTDDPRRVPVPAGHGDHDDVLVITGGRVFDAVDGTAHPATVVTRGKRISAVLAPENDVFPDGARIVDVRGSTVMPGLIDLHTHLTYTDLGLPLSLAENPADATLRAVERLRYYLESGITTVRDVASHGDAIFRLKAWVNEGRLPGPRIYAAGQLIVGTGGHGAEGRVFLTAPENPQAAIREASGADDWREAVREQFKRGADLIKLASHYSPEEIRAAVDEAHRLGLRVTVDAETQYIAMAVAAGVDCVEHPLPRDGSTIEEMARLGIASVPTLIPYDIILDEWGGYHGSTSRRFTLDKASIRDMLQRLHEAGVTLGVGTDLVAHWFRYLPDAYIEELESFVAVLDYTPAEALIAATRTNAEILGMAERLGTIEPGKLADLLVVAGRPDEDLASLANVEAVVRDGRLVVSGGRLRQPRHDSVARPR